MSEDIHWQKYASRFRTSAPLLQRSEVVPCMIVCIPVFAEKELIATLESLWACHLPDEAVEVILLFNGLESMSDEETTLHEFIWEECGRWIDAHKKDGIMFYPIYLQDQPDPKGGVGWARKLVLDEAARRLKQEGVMLCLDADCLVEQNYLRVVFDYFQHHPACHAASIYYEHRLEGLAKNIRQAIVQYELHLRYLVHAVRWTGHPFAYQTVGSCMAVRRIGYLAHGGMNTRQAGEDFYFLQKFIEVGSLGEIKGTTIYPSARVSHRVPFGTGRAMKQLLIDDATWMTTSFGIFTQIKKVFGELDQIRQYCLRKDQQGLEVFIAAIPNVSDACAQYLRDIAFYTSCLEITAHTASPSSFKKRFFRYFNAFRMIRYMHVMRDQFEPDVPVTAAAADLIKLIHGPIPIEARTEGYLQFFRNLDRK